MDVWDDFIIENFMEDGKLILAPGHPPHAPIFPSEQIHPLDI